MFKKILFILFIMISAKLSPQSGTTAFINGKIFTVNEEQPFAEAVVVEDNKIKFVGSTTEVLKFFDSTTTEIDLEGRLMLPGFNDTHLHFTGGGFYLLGINLRPAKSLKEFKQILKDYIDKFGNNWITGGRWDHEQWQIKKLPTKEDIDPITGNTPVLVSRIDGHMALANSYALKLAGITKNTPDPEGGVIMRDNITGEPTGILKDEAIELVRDIIPEDSEDEIYKAALRALVEAKKFGITSVQDMCQFDHLNVYKKLEKDGLLTCRISAVTPIAEYEKLIESGITHNSGSNYLQTGSVKAYADGSLGAKTAWFFEPYFNDTTTGLPTDILSDGRLRKWAFDVDNNKIQICTHAIGSKANAYMLALYKEITEKNPYWNRRFRIEHAQHIRPEDFKWFPQLNVIASVQPSHAIDDGVWVENRIGSEREKYSHNYKRLIDNGTVVAFGTDWPVAPLNPLWGIYAAVTRRTIDGKNPEGWLPEQKLTVEEAIKCYTLNSAYASFNEEIKGSIEPGKLADFVVLSDDILTIDPVKIKDAKVYMTIFDGRIIYKSKN